LNSLATANMKITKYTKNTRTWKQEIEHQLSELSDGIDIKGFIAQTEQLQSN